MPRKTPGTRHFKDSAFLKTLGRHCRRLRTQRGYSIDRLAKESDRLSTSVIHRLENGSGPVTVSALHRYASTLGLPPSLLLDFELPQKVVESTQKTGRAIHVLGPNHPKVKTGKFKTLLPLFSLEAAAGYFGGGKEVEPEGWIEIKPGRKLDSRMFIARAVGDSMIPRIHSGEYLVFRTDPAGSRQGKIVLAQYRGPADPETGGSYCVKQYRSSKVVDRGESWHHQQVVLAPLNPDYEPIILAPKNEHDFRIVAEYLFTLS